MEFSSSSWWLTRKKFAHPVRNMIAVEILCIMLILIIGTVLPITEGLLDHDFDEQMDHHDPYHDRFSEIDQEYYMEQSALRRRNEAIKRQQSMDKRERLKKEQQQAIIKANDDAIYEQESQSLKEENDRLQQFLVAWKPPSSPQRLSAPLQRPPSIRKANSSNNLQRPPSIKKRNSSQSLQRPLSIKKPNSSGSLQRPASIKKPNSSHALERPPSIKKNSSHNLQKPPSIKKQNSPPRINGNNTKPPKKRGGWKCWFGCCFRS